MSASKLKQYDRDELTFQLITLDTFFLRWIEKATPTELTSAIVSRIYATDGLNFRPEHFTSQNLIEFLPSPLLKIIVPIIDALLRWAINGSTGVGTKLMKYVKEATETYLEHQLISIEEFRGIEYLANRVETLFKCHNGEGTTEDKIKVYLYGFQTLGSGGRLAVLVAKWWTLHLFNKLKQEALDTLQLIIEQDDSNWLWYYYRGIQIREIRLSKAKDIIEDPTQGSSSSSTLHYLYLPTNEEVSSILIASKLALRTDDKENIHRCMTIFCRALAEILASRITISPHKPLELSSCGKQIDYTFRSYNQLAFYIIRRSQELPNTKQMYAQHIMYAEILNSTLLHNFRDPKTALLLLKRYNGLHAQNRDKTLLQHIGFIRKEFDYRPPLADARQQGDRREREAEGKENRHPMRNGRGRRHGHGHQTKNYSDNKENVQGEGQRSKREGTLALKGK